MRYAVILWYILNEATVPLSKIRTRAGMHAHTCQQTHTLNTGSTVTMPHFSLYIVETEREGIILLSVCCHFTEGGPLYLLTAT